MIAKTTPTAPTAPWRNRITGTGEEVPGQLLANPANWRIHPKAQQDALAGALDAVGWVQQVLVNRRSGFVVGPDGRQALATAIFARTDVMGFERLEYEMTPDAIELGLDAALPAVFELGDQIGEFGRGERVRADTPSPVLLIPVTNVPSNVHRSAQSA